jgi:hypothetical protein
MAREWPPGLLQLLRHATNQVWRMGSGDQRYRRPVRPPGRHPRGVGPPAPRPVRLFRVGSPYRGAGPNLLPPRMPPPRATLPQRPHPRPRPWRHHHREEHRTTMHAAPQLQNQRLVATSPTHTGLVPVDQPTGTHLPHPRRPDQPATHPATPATRTPGHQPRSNRRRSARQHRRPDPAPANTSTPPAGHPDSRSERTAPLFKGTLDNIRVIAEESQELGGVTDLMCCHLDDVVVCS